MKLPVFELEDYFEKWEFNTPYLLCCSDMESMRMTELLSMADAEAKKLWDDLWLGYTEVPGLEILRQEVSNLYPGLGIKDVTMFTGAGEGILCAMGAMLDKGDHVIVITPCYQSLKAVPESVGAEVSTVELSEKDGWRLDTQRVSTLMRENTKMIIINFPHNPTGTMISKEEQGELIAIARKSGVYIFSDEVYRFSEIEKSDALDPIASVYERGISLGVMSKSFGLPGIRIGWVATQDSECLDKMRKFKHYSTICNCAPGEVLALIALRVRDSILKNTREVAMKNLAILDEFFARKKDFVSWVRPKGGCTGFVKLRPDLDVEVFAQNLVEQQGVLILPGTVYQDSGNHFRLGFGRKNMTEGLDRLETFIKGNY